jgi:hypothetical protein
MKLVCANGPSSTSSTTVNTAVTNPVNNISQGQCVNSTTSLHHFAKANYTPHYQNPPLAPRFLALSQQQQQQQQGTTPLSQQQQQQQTNQQTALRMIPNFGIALTNQQQQQAQKTTPVTTTTTSSTTPTQTTTSTNILSLSTNQQQQNTNVNITSGNSLQSFITARGLVNGTNTGNNFNQTLQNASNPGLCLLNQLKQQQQQQLQQQQQQVQHQIQQQQQANSAVTNSTTTALIANLAAAATNQTFSQSLPQCTLNNTLFVGNLHASLQEIDLIQVFRPFGRIVECCKKWLHFGFVKFSTEEEACRAYVTLNGFRLKGRPMRLEFQNRTKKVTKNLFF